MIFWLTFDDHALQSYMSLPSVESKSKVLREFVDALVHNSMQYHHVWTVSINFVHNQLLHVPTLHCSHWESHKRKFNHFFAVKQKHWNMHEYFEKFAESCFTLSSFL